MTQRLVNKLIIKEALGLRAHLLDGLPNRVNVSIDSRILLPGDIFFAIRGDIDDGHRYIKDAFNKGASLVIAEQARRHEVIESTKIHFVDNSLKAFFELAKQHLLSFPLTKIAITGSNGKTTTKEMLKAALSKVLSEKTVYASSGNKNNHFGLPLSALEVTNEHRVAIFEMGMNHAGEINSLCQIVIPSIGVITNISHAHEGNFKNGIDGVQQEKGELFQFVGSLPGTIIVNLDDERVVTEAGRAPLAKSINFGHSENAQVRIVSSSPYSMERQYQTVELAVLKAPSFSCNVPLLGAHQGNNAACALSVVHAMGLPVLDASAGIMAMEKNKGRLNVERSRMGYVVINDGYNANPISMQAGIFASLTVSAKRRIAAIGSMGELGPQSEKYHIELGKILGLNFDLLFICGKDAHHAVFGAKSVGMGEQNIVVRESSAELIEPLRGLVKNGDVIFVKGSLSTNMQLLAKALQE